MVPLRSATTLLVTPALISDCVPMIERVRPAQLTMMVVSGSGAARPARSTSSAPGTLTEPGMFMVAYSSNRRTSRMAILALACDQRRDFVRAQRRRVPARLDQLAKRLGVGIDVLEQLVAGRRARPAVRRRAGAHWCSPAPPSRSAAAAQGLRRRRKRTIGTSLRGSRVSASSAIRSAAMLAANSGWPVAKAASCLTSSSAISSRSNSIERTCEGVTDGTVMEDRVALRKMFERAQFVSAPHCDAIRSAPRCDKANIVNVGFDAPAVGKMLGPGDPEIRDFVALTVAVDHGIGGSRSHDGASHQVTCRDRSTRRPRLFGAGRLGNFQALLEIGVPKRHRVVIKGMGELAERHAEFVLVAHKLDSIFHPRLFLAEGLDSRQIARRPLHVIGKLRPEQICARIRQIGRFQRKAGHDERAAEGARRGWPWDSARRT